MKVGFEPTIPRPRDYEPGRSSLKPVDAVAPVFCPTNEIAFPMTRDGAVLDFCGPLPDGDGIYDLTAPALKVTSLLKRGYWALGRGYRVTNGAPSPFSVMDLLCGKSVRGWAIKLPRLRRRQIRQRRKSQLRLRVRWD